MRKLLVLLVSVLFCLSVNSQTLYKGLEVGMTKKETKSEFKQNKKTYTEALFGSYLYRAYHQNFGYKNGGLNYINFTAKGYALGMTVGLSKTYFSDMVRLLKNTGYSVDDINTSDTNYLKHTVGGSYIFHNKIKNKTIFIAIPQYGKLVLFNIGVMKYVKPEKSDYNSENSF